MNPAVLLLALFLGHGLGLSPAPALGADRVDFETPPNHGGFWSFAYSPNDRWVAGGTGIVTITITTDGSSSTSGGELIVWDAKTGAVIKNFGEHGETVDFVAFSADGKTLVSASSYRIDNTPHGPPLVRVWDLRRSKLLREITPSGCAFLKPQLTTDGKSLVWVCHSQDTVPKGEVRKPGKIEVWDVKRGKTRWSHDKVSASCFAISPDGKTIIADYTDRDAEGKRLSRGLIAWNLATGDDRWRVEFNNSGYYPPKKIIFLPAGGTFLTVNKKEITRWAVADGSRGDRFSLDWKSTPNEVAVDSA
ncbi:MAG TPA: hypothetical protein EYN00_00185, partial [Planctomycetes bacterium]|nr:hypothetical protein [Planctomycetota bacterium]